MEPKKYPFPKEVMKKKALKRPSSETNVAKENKTCMNPQDDVHQTSQVDPDHTSDSGQSAASAPPAILVSMKDHLRNIIEMMGEASEDQENEISVREGDTSEMLSNALEETSTLLSSAVSSMVEVTVGDSEVKLSHGVTRVDMTHLKRENVEENKCTCVEHTANQNPPVKGDVCDSRKKMPYTGQKYQKTSCTCNHISAMKVTLEDRTVHLAQTQTEIKQRCDHEAKCLCKNNATALEKEKDADEVICACFQRPNACNRVEKEAPKKMCSCGAHHSIIVPCPDRLIATTPICHCYKYNQNLPSVPRKFTYYPHTKYTEGRCHTMHVQQTPASTQQVPLMKTHSTSMRFRRKKKQFRRLFTSCPVKRKKKTVNQWYSRLNNTPSSIQQDTNIQEDLPYELFDEIPEVQKLSKMYQTSNYDIHTGSPKKSMFEPLPERVDVYYFDHGNSGYYRTTDKPPATLVDIYMETSDEYANQFWADIFGTLHIFFTFITHFLLQLLRFFLYSIIRPLTVGIIQMLSDYFLKPSLSILFNGLIQPTLILLYNVATSIRDLCQPLAQAFGFFLREIAVVFRATRLIEVQNIRGEKHI